MNMPGVALLADLDERFGEGSLTQRRYRLESLFPALNRDLAGSLLARFQLRGGEGIGAVLRADADVGTVVLRLWKAVHPLRMETALATGSVSTTGPLARRPDEPGPGIHRFDGPAIEEAGRRLRSLAASPHLLFPAAGDDAHGARELRQLGTQLYLRLLGWTPRQLEVYETRKTHGSQQETAEALGIRQPTVSETLRRIDATATASAESYFVERTATLLPRPAEG